MEDEQRLAMLIDDDPAQCRSIAALAARDGWRLIVAADAESAIATLGTHNGMRLSAILLDQTVPGKLVCNVNACDLIAELGRRRPALPILLLAAPASMMPITSASPMLMASASRLLAVAAMRAGATDTLVKPVAPDRLMQALRAATMDDAPHPSLQPLNEKLVASPDFEAMIGASPGFRSALAIAAKAARGHGPVLIEGENGVGKELLASAMHAAGMRAKAPLRIVNVATTPPGSLESSLFGHEKGAFPDAFERQIGAIQRCDGGTLMLDAVDRLPLAIQQRLLETLVGSNCRPVGARYSFRIDVRFIFAADAPMQDLVAAGHFLPELVRGMAAVSLTLPPLRQRIGDIAALARHFLGRIGEQPGLRPLGVTDGALTLLAAYHWPGNVRQLQSVLFRAAVFCAGDALTPDDFPQLFEIVSRGAPAGGHVHRQDSAGVTLFTADGNMRLLGEIEGDVIRLAIGHYHGRMTEVARRLGIGRSTLYRKLSELGIDNAA